MMVLLAVDDKEKRKIRDSYDTVTDNRRMPQASTENAGCKTKVSDDPRKHHRVFLDGESMRRATSGRDLVANGRKIQACGNDG